MDTSGSPDEPKDEDLVTKFKQSKTGWHRNSSTGTRQAQQLTNIFRKVSEMVGEKGPDVILLKHADELEQVVRSDLPNHTALVKSNVLECTAVRSRIDMWKRDASALYLHRAAELQDRMGEEGYLPSRDEPRELRERTLAELERLTQTDPQNRNEAVKPPEYRDKPLANN